MFGVADSVGGLTLASLYGIKEHDHDAIVIG